MLRVKRARNKLLKDYYEMGSCYGKPASLQMLGMIYSANCLKGNADLW